MLVENGGGGGTRAFSTYTDLDGKLESGAGSVDPPERPKKWPTPLVTQQDVDTYFHSLYANGWSIRYRRQPTGGAIVSTLETSLVVRAQSVLSELVDLVRGLEKVEKVCGAIINLYKNSGLD